ncbi:putative bifunctional diguanylate cyclase/phosphodiesterase [Sapientia aquatica]|uniref:GGDEF domain-containing protein n=1 Tax=Sapientia aquatica TaxID=1549640 RepID=A0A4R5VMI5_9BURK|nr:bifunctional diguanylate cyclase/phosphodiesterase [Sapientia aquatica]TDK59258.1 GGDEF domain-containing protein [Sapientia aquatica]
MVISFNDAFGRNTKILKSKASKISIQAVSVAIVAVIAATLLVCFTNTHTISIEGIINAQTSNMVLWVLDGLPFVFGYVGQYTSYVLTQEANLMVLEQTDELRQHAFNLEKQAAYTATHDALTELPNRALFHDRLGQSLRHPQDANSGLTLLMLSIENLKEIQDAIGINNTDLIIKQLSTRLISWAGSTGTVARIDTNSFAILLDEISDKNKAEEAARNLIKAIEPHFAVNGLKLTLHPSIGIVLAPMHGEDADLLMQRASVAQFFASSSVAGFSTYSPNMDEHSPRRLTLMGELKRAIERDELQLYYQPKINLTNNTVTSVEALIRWKHEQHGYIPPDEFILLAERHRMIRPLSHWVLQEAFKTCAEWHRDGIDLTISINLSTKDLLDPELPDQIAGIAAKTKVQPEWMHFEITESSIMGDPTRALIVIERLRSMGYQFSIDDFGTGYSSLAYLKKLPISELKIDKSFVLDMLENESDAIIVRAIVNLAHNLGLTVTAEGIENAESLEMLKAVGCDVGQGFLFSKAVPQDELRAWLAEWNGRAH